MPQTRKTDAELIRLIRGSEAERDEAFSYIYLHTGWWEIARRMVLRDNGSEADASDVFQDAVIRFDNHIRNCTFRQESQLKTFFLGICRGRWYSARRSVKRLVFTDDAATVDRVETGNPAVIMLTEERKTLVDELLNMLDKLCREVLYFYKLAYSMEEIASELDLKNPNNAKQKVHHCRKKLRQLAAKHPALSEYFNS